MCDRSFFGAIKWFNDRDFPSGCKAQCVMSVSRSIEMHRMDLAGL